MDKETVKQRIKEAVCQVAQDAKVILFGSRARGTDSAESDWDILVLLNQPLVSFKEEQTIRHKLFDLELEVEEPFSTFVYSQFDWNAKLSVTPFYKNVTREGILL